MSDWQPKGSDRHDITRDGKTIASAFSNGQAIVTADGVNLNRTFKSLAEAKGWCLGQLRQMGY
jgi:hypothetical protein